MDIPSMMPKTMMAIGITGPGGPEMLRGEELPVPVPGPDRF